MSNTLLLKRSNSPGAVPNVGDLTLGELAINYTDGNLFYKNNLDQIAVIASNKFVSVTGNISGGNVNVTSNIVASGNVTANYFLGDGSLLTNVVSSGNIITNGNSYAWIASVNGNIDIQINGIANTAQFSSGSFYVSGPIATVKTIDHLSLVAANVNAVMISPVTVGASGNIFVPTSSTLTIFTPT
jgi:hypothetical protein